MVVWESLSESEQEQWSKKMDKSKDWVVWCRSRKIDDELRPFEADGKEFFSNCSKQAKAKAGEKMDTKGDNGQSVRWKAWWRQSNIKCAVSEEYASSWVYPDCHVADEEKAVDYILCEQKSLSKVDTDHLPEREMHAEIGINLVCRSRHTVTYKRRVCQNPSRVITLGRTP
jgi:hypothetical protein